jgi:hypothetical protein
MIQELACDLLVLALWPVFIAKRCISRVGRAGVVPRGRRRPRSEAAASGKVESRPMNNEVLALAALATLSSSFRDIKWSARCHECSLVITGMLYDPRRNIRHKGAESVGFSEIDRNPYAVIFAGERFARALMRLRQNVDPDDGPRDLGEHRPGIRRGRGC